MRPLVNISIINHYPIVISDFLDALLHEIESLNFDVQISRDFIRGGKNIIVEGFTPELNAGLIKNFQKCDENLVLIMTEIVKDGKLDSTSPGPDEEVTGWYNKDSEKWTLRSKSFFEIVEYFGSIVCVSEEIYKSVLALNLSAKLIYWKPKYHGPVQGIDKIWKSNAQHRKTTSLMFSGSPTSYRDEQINNLRNSKISVANCLPRYPNNVRELFHKQSLLAFGPKHYRSTYQLSKMRLMWCLDHFFPIIMQNCQGKTDLDEYCVFYDTIDDLIEKLHNYDRTLNECLAKNFEYIKATAGNQTSLAEALS